MHTRATALACLVALVAATTSTVVTAQVVTPTKAFVVNILDSTVAEIDLTTMKHLRTLHTGPRPYYPCLSGDNSVLAVTVEGEGKVKFYDVATLKQRGEISIGKMYAEHLMSLPDGRTAILASRFRNALLFIDLFEMKEKFAIEVPNPHNIRIGPSGRYVYVQSKLDPALSVVDIQERKVVKRHPVKLTPRGLAVSPDEKTIWFGANWINAVFAMDVETGRILNVLAIPAPSNAPTIQENTYHGLEFIDEHTLLAANEGNSTLDVIDTRTMTWVSRTTEVQRPAGLIRLVGTDHEFIVTNKADNSVVRARLAPGNRVEMQTRMVVGKGEDLFAKRFVLFN
jgi:DNA-binding beta-propeller fold protein YncE